ncbi:unnamed protein product, partial [Staurois parvus]
MVRCLLGHMTGPRMLWAIHKARHFSRMCTGHPAEGRTTPRKWERVPVKFRYPFPLPPQRSAVSGNLLYCLQSLVIPCTVCSLWSFPVLCPQSLVIPYT